MSKRDPYLFLFDIYVAILKIEKVSSSYQNAQKLKHDFMAWDSIVREFEIIGEATRHLIDADIFTAEYRAIVDFRNVLIHAYFGIDEDEVWHIVQHHLHEIKDVVTNTIKHLNNEIKMQYLKDILDENQHHVFITDALKKFNE
jgi:uncharacterized protein with HEPN domain